MNKKLSFDLDLELPEPPRYRIGDGPTADRRALALAEAVIHHVLPPLASRAGVETHKLAGALLAELGYDVGRSHAPDAAMDVLAVATERLQDAIVRRRGPPPAPTVRGPSRLQ